MEVDLPDSISLDCNGNRTVKTVTDPTVNNNVIIDAEESANSNETAKVTQISNSNDVNNRSITESSNVPHCNGTNDISSKGRMSHLSPTRDHNPTDFDPPSNMTQNTPYPPITIPPSCSPLSPSSPPLPPPLSPISDPLGAISEQQRSAVQWAEPTQTPHPQSLPKPVVFSPEFLEPERRDSAVCDLDVDQTHFQQRRLTGDSGIEVCHCQIDHEGEDEEDDEDEEKDLLEDKTSAVTSDDLHDSADCSVRAQLSPSELGDTCGSGSATPARSDAVVIAMETV